MSTDINKRVLGPFELGEKLGVGGMGIVYRATYLKTGQQVAVKVLAPDLTADPKIAKRFEREMEILKKLKDPHIIQYYGGSVSGSQRYYAMELLPGGALDRLLKKKGKFTWEETIDYGLQIAKALEHAHNAGVIHRDLKPANLLITKDGTLKLSDFGIARDTQATQITAAGKTVGTMAYMAPEQITGKQPVSRKTDLYALGCVLFEMLTGRTPFAAETQPELLFKHVDEDPPSVREFSIDVPIWLDQLVEELLSKDPNDRPHDALAVQVKLQEVREKVAQQESMVGQTVGGAGATRRDGDPTLERLLSGKKKKKRKKKGDAAAFYEQTWFLAAGLAGVIGIIVWAFWPESEAKIFARVEPLMAANDPVQWSAAEKDLLKLTEKYPAGAHAEQARKWLDDIALDRQVRQHETRMGRRNFQPDTEAERLFVEARQFEAFGDRLSAIDVYQNMQTLLADDKSLENRAFLAMAQREAERIKASAGTESDRTAFIEKQIADADQLFRDGKKLEAREKWRSVKDLYQGKSEFETQVKQAEARLADPDAALQE
jgi:serine/threonine-protein kinase